MSNYEERNRKLREQELAMEGKTVANEDAAPKDDNHIPTKIGIEPTEMEGTFKSKLITSSKLCSMINKVMRMVTPDFEGSRIQISGSNVIAELFFAENPHAIVKDGQFKAIERFDGLYSKARDAASLIERYNKRKTTSRQYELTRDGKEALSEFVPNQFVVNREKHIVDWSRVVSEDTEQMYGGQNKIYVIVQFDLHKFLRKVYGEKAADGSRYIYEISVVRPLNNIKLPGGNIVSTKWLLNVMQVDDANVRATYEDSGFSPLQNTLNIIR
jgi:hypothetical protein